MKPFEIKFELQNTLVQYRVALKNVQKAIINRDYKTEKQHLALVENRNALSDFVARIENTLNIARGWDVEEE